VIIADGAKVLLFDPVMVLIRVSSFGPLPQALEDIVVYELKSLPACAMSMVHGPALDQRIELPDQQLRSDTWMTVDDFPDLVQERFYGSTGWTGQAFILSLTLAGVFAHLDTQEVKAVPNVRDASLLFGEFQATFGQKLPNKRLHHLFQQVF
jgi:hypothetical protein